MASRKVPLEEVIKQAKEDDARIFAQLEAMQAEPDVVAALAKEEGLLKQGDLLCKGLTTQERALIFNLKNLSGLSRQASLVLTQAESQLLLEQNKRKLAAAASPVKRLKYYDNTWVGKNGNIDTGNQAQHRREEKHFVHYQTICKASGAEIEGLPAEELVARLLQCRAAAEAGKQLCEHHADLYAIAHDKGWAVANAFDGAAGVARLDEEKQKKLHAAQKLVNEESSKSKSTGGANSAAYNAYVSGGYKSDYHRKSHGHSGHKSDYYKRR